MCLLYLFAINLLHLYILQLHSSAPSGSASWISWPLAFLFASSDDGPKSNVPIRQVIISSKFMRKFAKKKFGFEKKQKKQKNDLWPFSSNPRFIQSDSGIWMQRCGLHHHEEIQQLAVDRHHHPKMKIAIQLRFADHRSAHQCFNANVAHRQIQTECHTNKQTTIKYQQLPPIHFTIKCGSNLNGLFGCETKKI